MKWVAKLVQQAATQNGDIRTGSERETERKVDGQRVEEKEIERAT